MNKPMSKLPLELLNKNDADFVQITNRLRDALSKIAADPKLKPTQSMLAKLSGVSRGTINFRKWPLEKLENIKLQRQAEKKAASEQPTPEQKIKLTLEDYQNKLYLSREEVRHWKDKFDQANVQAAQYLSVIELKTKQISMLEETLSKALKHSKVTHISQLNLSKKDNVQLLCAA